VAISRKAQRARESPRPTELATYFVRLLRLCGKHVNDAVRCYLEAWFPSCAALLVPSLTGFDVWMIHGRVDGAGYGRTWVPRVPQLEEMGEGIH